MIALGSRLALSGGHRRAWRPGFGAVMVFAFCAALLMPFAWLGYQALFAPEPSALDAAGVGRSLGITAALLAGTLSIALVIGVGCAWLCVMCRFPGSALMKVFLLLPLTVPPYLFTYVYSAMFDAMGVTFFRGMPGAILSLSLTTYPYVFLFSTIAFLLQPCHLFSTARVLGLSPGAIFFRVSIPVARPAIIAGLALVMMETMGDFGVAEYFGLPTMSVAVYDTWLNRGDFRGAAQLSMITMLVMFAILVLERAARARREHYSHARRSYCRDRHYPLAGWRAGAALAACVAVLAVAFAAPAFHLARLSLIAGADAWRKVLGDAAANSFALGLAVSSATLAVGVLLSVASRPERGRRGRARAALAKLSLTGYAFPGTILALAVLGACFGLADALKGVGVDIRPLLSASLLMLCLGLVIKFVIITYSACDAGLKKIPPSMSSAARLSGMGSLETLLKVHLPLLKPALLAALMLVFVDVIKELPLTLLLRPLGFDTLSTYVFQYASDEELLQAAPSGLLLVVMGLPAVAILRRFMDQQWREGQIPDDRAEGAR